MKNIITEQLQQIPIAKQKIEIVERKGIGHPDTICDSIMNEISIELCKMYMEKVGAIMHHNIDKAMLTAGEVEVKFGGGAVKKPMLLVIGDRATFRAGDVEFPVNELSITTTQKWFKENLRFVDPNKHVKIQVELAQGSASLQDIFKRKNEVFGAGDTSAAVGYAPFTPTEQIAFDVERFLNSKKFKEEFPESGEDIKVMAFRTNSNLHLTIAMAFVDRYINSVEDYFRKKEEITERVRQLLANNENFSNVEINLNTLDARDRGIGGLYLTVLGTSADNGDTGQVGRGNRANGVISLNRPASEEAAAGKNPVSHVGKIYNLLSFKIAKEVYDQISGLEEVYVWLLSQIGRPINDPKIAAAQVVLSGDNNLESVKKQIEEVVNKELDNIKSFCQDLANGKVAVC